MICNYGQTGTPISCNEDTKICTVGSNDSISSVTDVVNGLSKALIEHRAEKESGLDAGIISHITEYKFLYNYTEINWFVFDSP